MSMESLCVVTGPDVVTLSDDFLGNGAEFTLSGDTLVVGRFESAGSNQTFRYCQLSANNAIIWSTWSMINDLLSDASCAEGINQRPESLTHLLVFTMQSLNLYRHTSW